MHLAIVNKDLELVKELVSNGANVNQRACGRYFLPDDQKLEITGITNYEGAQNLAFLAYTVIYMVHQLVIRSSAIRAEKAPT